MLVENELQIRTNSLLNWFLGSRSACLDDQPAHVKDLISAQIASSYKMMNGCDAVGDEYSCVIDPINESDYDHDEYLLPVIEMRDFARVELMGDIRDVILFGSMVSHKHSKGWSDVDGMAIIKSSTLFDPIAMRRLRKNVREFERLQKKIDPLQHHGLLMLTSFDLVPYTDMFLPHPLLRNARTLCDSLELRLVVRNSHHEQSKRLRDIQRLFHESAASGFMAHHPLNNVFLSARVNAGDAMMYQLKYFLSVLAMLPSYYMNMTGNLCTKRESFVLCMPHIRPKHWEIIDRALRIRTMWPIECREYDHSTNAVPAWIIDILGQNYFDRAAALVDDMIQSLRNDGHIA